MYVIVKIQIVDLYANVIEIHNLAGSWPSTIHTYNIARVTGEGLRVQNTVWNDASYMYFPYNSLNVSKSVIYTYIQIYVHFRPERSGLQSNYIEERLHPNYIFINIVVSL